MSSTPSSKEATTKTTTTARVAITSGPAAATAEARKNKKKRANPILEIEAPEPTSAPVVPMADIRTTEDNRVITYVAAHPIVPYPHSEPSASPSPLIINRFLGGDSPSPSPPVSPSPHRTPTSSSVANAAHRNDTMMEDPANYLGSAPPPTTQNPPRPLTLTHSRSPAQKETSQSYVPPFPPLASHPPLQPDLKLQRNVTPWQPPTPPYHMNLSTNTRVPICQLSTTPTPQPPSITSALT